MSRVLTAKVKSEPVDRLTAPAPVAVMMSWRSSITIGSALLLLLAGKDRLEAALVAPTGAGPSSQPDRLGPPAPAVSAPVAEPNPTIERGRELAQGICSGCHVLPEPQLLIKRVWAHHVLPQVALRLGVEPANYEDLKEGKILEAANWYPTSPAIPEEDWFAIWNYYVSTAPYVPLPPPDKPKMNPALPGFRVKKWNFHPGVPMTSLVKMDPARKVLYVGDAYAGLLATIGAAGNLVSRLKIGGAPVSLAVHPSGLHATLIGSIFPSDALEGSLVRIPGSPSQPPTTLLDKLRRPTDAAVGDLNQDGRDDLVVCSFGNLLGRFSWFEAQPDGHFEEHVLLERAGAERVELYDFNRDGRLDIIVLMAQAREGVYLFYNQGQGLFMMETVFEKPPPYGYVYFELVDFNRDGFVDILTANGDNGDNPAPHRYYHGLRLYLNDRTNRFSEVWFYPMEGAYKGRALDFDLDGDLDIAAISYFPDFQQQPIESFVYLENQGALQFAPHSFKESADGRWIAMDAGDLDGDGDADVALGSLILGPTTIPVPAAVQDNWRTNGAAVLVLENLRR